MIDYDMLYIIYCIWVKTDSGVLRYYGHTKNMTVRKGKHVAQHKAWVKAGRPKKVSEVHGATRSVLVLEHEDWRMDKVDEIECDDKKDAEKLEGEYILKNECVNMRVEGRTPQEYRETHREQQKEYQKHYVETHKEQRKEYRETRKEKTKEYNEKYREQNKAEIEAKRAEKVTCEVCNAVVCKSNIANHRKTKKCLAALNALNPDINTIQ